MYYVMTLSTPSTGLQPESKTTSIVAFDPFAQGIPQTVPWPADEDVSASYEIAPTYYGFIARRNLGQGLVGFDGKSLQPSFRSNDRIDTVNFAGYDAFGPAPEGKQTEVFHSAKDGTEVGRNTHHLQASLQAGGRASPTESCSPWATRGPTSTAISTSKPTNSSSPSPAGGGEHVGRRRHSRRCWATRRRW